jgi:hypothetical protein
MSARASLLLGAALSVVAAAATPARADGGAVPDLRAATTSATAPPSADDYVDPSYDPAKHGGLPYGVYLHMTRGTGRRSTGMMATGIVLVGAGVVAMATGGGVYLVAGHCNSPVIATPGGTLPQDCPTDPGRATGFAVTLAGAIGVALGIPLWVVGASDVPWMEAAGMNPAPPSSTASTPSTTARVAPALAPGPTPLGAGLVWRF